MFKGKLLFTMVIVVREELCSLKMSLGDVQRADALVHYSFFL